MSIVQADRTVATDASSWGWLELATWIRKRTTYCNSSTAVETKWSSFFDRNLFYPLKLNYIHSGSHFEFFYWQFWFCWRIPGLLINLWKQSGLRFLIYNFFTPWNSFWFFFAAILNFFFVDSWSTHKVVETKWSSFFHKLLWSALKVWLVVVGWGGVVEQTNNHNYS